MIYLGGVTLGHFNLYPVGFQPKDTPADGAPAPVADEDVSGRSLFPAATARLFRGALPSTARNHR